MFMPITTCYEGKHYLHANDPNPSAGSLGDDGKPLPRMAETSATSGAVVSQAPLLKLCTVAAGSTTVARYLKKS